MIKKVIRFIKNKNQIIILLFLFTFHLVNNIIIVQNDTTPYVYDMGNLRVKSLAFYNAFKEFNIIKIYNLIVVKDLFYPPLLMITPLPIYIFGTNQDMTTLSNMVYFFVLIFSTYFFVKKIKNKNIGLFCSIIISIIPGIFSFSRVFMPDFGLTSLFMLSLALMVHTNKFKNTKTTILFGISCGIGMLMKWTFVLYLFSPFIIYFLMSFNISHINKLHSNKRFQILVLSMFIGLAICLVWYFNKVPFLIHRASTLNKEYIVQLGKYEPFSSENLKWYLTRIQDTYLLTFYKLILFTSLVFLFKNKNKFKPLLVLSIVVPYFLISFSAWKAARYIMPVIPLIVIISVLGILDLSNFIKNKKFKKKINIILNLIIISLLLITYVNINYEQETIVMNKYYPKIQKFSPTNLFSEGLPRAFNFNYELDNIFLKIINNSNTNLTKNNRIDVLVLPNSDLFDAFYHENLINNHSLEIDRGFFCIGSGGKNNCFPSNQKNYANKNFVCSFDFVIDYEGEFSYDKYGVVFQPIDSKIHKDIFEPLIKNWQSCKKSFSLIDEFFNKTDTSNRHKVTIQLYKKNE